MKKQLLALLVIGIMLFGCTGGQPPAQQPVTPPPTGSNQTPPANNTANNTVTPPAPKPSPFPMALVYEMQQVRNNGNATNQTLVMSYWLESEKNCSGKSAVVGLDSIQVSSEEGQPTAFEKVTVYLDNGLLVGSNMQQQSELSFDTATSQASDIDFMLFMNYIFNAAGGNFMSDPIWNASEPEILKGVNVFGTMANVSVAKIGDSTTGIVPCTEFGVTVRAVNGPSEQLTVCVAPVTDTNPLPYVVYLESAGGQGPNGAQGGISWKLDSVAKSKSNVTLYPQCLAPVVCTPVPQMTQAQMNSCQQQGGNVVPTKNDSNCVTEYTCMTMRDQAEAQIVNNMDPSCPAPSSQLVDALLACWNQNKNNVNFERGNMGCITAVHC